AADAVTLCVPFRLHINDVEAERILLDDAVNPAVAGMADSASHLLTAAAIAHRDEQIDDQCFEECGRQFADALEQVGLQNRAQSPVAGFHHFLRCGSTILGGNDSWRGVALAS